MWPAYLAALLLSLPAAPVGPRPDRRGTTPDSAFDRVHHGDDTSDAAGRVAPAALVDDEEEEDSDDEEA
jgi:hypothetical protein